MLPALFPSKRPVTTWMLFAAVALCVGCGPAWTVVKQANPNPMSPQKSFAVEPVRFEALKVGQKTEEQYLADKSAKDPQFEAKWKGDLAAIAQMFSAEVMQGAKGLQISAGAPTQAGPFVVRPMVSFVEPGQYAVVYNIPSQVHLTVQILDPQGTVLDEITMNSTVAASSIMGVPINVAVGDRLRACGKQLGSLTARYLRERAGAK